MSGYNVYLSGIVLVLDTAEDCQCECCCLSCARLGLGDQVLGGISKEIGKGIFLDPRRLDKLACIHGFQE